jgi:hypothetical protein
MASLKVDIASEFTGAAAFKKADKATKGLDKGVKKLGRSLGLALGTAGLVSLAKNAAKAFMEDEVSATKLANAVKNLGMEMETPAIEKYIEALSTTAAVADDRLRPAFQALLTQTGSLVLSQEMLAQAIEVSRGSGVALETVTQDLANAYVGNTKGLKKYNLGLTKAELSTASFATIQAKLAKQFKGSSAAYLQTYAGKMEAITVAGGEIQEILGEGVIDALMALTDNTSIEGLVADLKDGAKAAGDFLVEVGKFGSNIAGAVRTVSGWIDASIKKLDEWTDAWNRATGNAEEEVVRNPQEVLDDYINRSGESKRTDIKLTDKYVVAQKAAAAAAAAAAAKAAKLQREALAAQKKANILKNASAIFDMKQIQIIAALKGNISKEDRLRLELQFALATDNTAEAQRLTYKLAIAQGMTVALAKELASLPAASNPFAAWKGYLDDVELKAKKIAADAAAAAAAAKTGTGGAGGGTSGAGAGDGSTPPPRAIPPVFVPKSAADAYGGINNVTGINRIGVETGGNQTIKVDLNIDGKLIAQILQDASANGNQVYVNRVTGQFFG